MIKSKSQVLLVLTVLLIFLTVTVFLALKYLSNSEISDADTVLSSSVKAGDYLNLQGEAVTFADYDQKIRIINSWASWSPFSRDELPMLNKLAGEYSAKGVVFLAINRNEPKGTVEAYLKTLPALDNIIFVLDTNDKLYSAFSGYAMPETIFYNQSGDTLLHQRGALTEEQVREVLNKALSS